jgi:MtN3 and saliva related transmembrane protein
LAEAQTFFTDEEQPEFAVRQQVLPTCFFPTFTSLFFPMTAIDLLGMKAGCISSVTFLPQVIKTWKTKSAADISLLMFTFATISVIMWLVYGIILNNIPIIFTNSMVLLFSLIMLYFKFRYSGKKMKEMQNVQELVTHEN